MKEELKTKGKKYMGYVGILIGYLIALDLFESPWARTILLFPAFWMFHRKFLR